jgi:hypothetical protein
MTKIIKNVLPTKERLVSSTAFKPAERILALTFQKALLTLTLEGIKLP